MPKPKPKTKDLSEIRIFVSPKTHATMTERAAFVGASIAPYVAKIVERAAASRPIDDAEWREAAMHPEIARPISTQTEDQ